MVPGESTRPHSQRKKREIRPKRDRPQDPSAPSQRKKREIRPKRDRPQDPSAPSHRKCVVPQLLHHEITSSEVRTTSSAETYGSHMVKLLVAQRGKHTCLERQEVGLVARRKTKTRAADTEPTSKPAHRSWSHLETDTQCILTKSTCQASMKSSCPCRFRCRKRHNRAARS